MTSAFNKSYTGTRSFKNPNCLQNLAVPAPDPAGVCGRFIPAPLLTNCRLQSRFGKGHRTESRAGPGSGRSVPVPPLAALTQRHGDTAPSSGKARGLPSPPDKPLRPPEGRAPDAPAGRPCQLPSHGPPRPKQRRGWGGQSSLTLPWFPKPAGMLAFRKTPHPSHADTSSPTLKLGVHPNCAFWALSQRGLRAPRQGSQVLHERNRRPRGGCRGEGPP